MESSYPNRPKQLPVPRPSEIREKALALHKSGVSPRDVADQMSLPLGTVKSWVYRSRNKDAQQLAIVPAETEEIEIPSELIEKQTFYTERMSDAACRLADHVSRLDGEALVKNADRVLKADKTARTALKLDVGSFNPIIQIGVLCQPIQPKRVAAQEVVTLEAESGSFSE